MGLGLVAIGAQNRFMKIVMIKTIITEKKQKERCLYSKTVITGCCPITWRNLRFPKASHGLWWWNISFRHRWVTSFPVHHLKEQ